MFDKNQIEQIVNIAFKAGEIAKNYLKNKNFSISKKADNSKVTSADIEISNFIGSSLKEIFKDIPIICEEGDFREYNSEVFFLIDPIDGTASFSELKDTFSINIALIKNKKPVFGLIYAPLFEGGKMAYSEGLEVKLFYDILTNKKERNIKIVNLKEDNKELRIITSVKTKEEDLNNFIEQFYPDMRNNCEIKRVSSAVKFFSLLERKSNIYLHFRPSMEWDIAAGQILIELIGGKVKKIVSNQEKYILAGDLDYQKESFLNPAFVAKIID